MNNVFLWAAIVFEVAATSTMPLTRGFTRPVPSALVAIGYAAAFYLLSLALRTMPTGVAYAIWSGAGIVLVAAIAWIWQGQRLASAQLVGIALILAGVLLVNLTPAWKVADATITP